MTASAASSGRRRSLHKGLVCALLAVSLQALPLEVRPVPDAEPVLGTQPAAAQSTPTVEVRVGTPAACLPVNGVDWSPANATDPDWPTAEECTLELPACPASPLHGADSGVFMRLSSPPTGLNTSEFPDAFNELAEYSYAGSGEAVLRNYPDFCELRVEAAEPEHGACVVATGHVMQRYTHSDPMTPDCRLLRPLACPDGLQFVTSKTCRGVQRRTWRCTTPEEPHNRFNKCFVEMTGGTGSNPACAAAWPQLPLSSCGDYVGGDYFRNPTTNCTTETDYTTGTPVRDVSNAQAIPGAMRWPLTDAAPAASLGVPASVSNHWCSYDARALRSECHGPASGPSARPPDCDVASAASPSLCLKRASEVGGCAAVAQAIKCRAFMQAFVETPTTVPLDYVRLQGCSPCLALPFRPIPPQCPPSLHSDAEIGFLFVSRSGTDRETNPDADTVHRNRGSPMDDPLCEDPPSGRLKHSPTHASGLAVVNSAVIFILDGLEFEQQRSDDLLRIVYNPDFRPLSPEFGDAIWFTDEHNRRRRERAPYQLRYAAGSDTSADRRIKTWRDPVPGDSYAQLQDIAGLAECYAQWGPTFQLVVRELWPDYGGTAFTENDENCTGALAADDAAAILDLFGPDSLSWWCALDGAEREQRTAARGIAWWPDFSTRTFPPSLTAEQARDAAMTKTLPCAFGIPTGTPDPQGETIWCRWIPQRPGFYQFHAGGAWPMQRSTGVQSRTAHVEMQHILDYFNDPAHGQQRRTTAYNWLSSWRQWYGLTDRTWINMGLDYIDRFTPVRMLPEPSGWLDSYWYDADNVALTGCPPIDLRVRCTSDPVIDYTETDPIGVIVYEARVVTRAPS